MWVYKGRPIDTGEIAMSDCAKVPGWNISDCCESCHEDHDEYGYDLCAITVNGQKLQVCCHVDIWDSEQTKAIQQGDENE